MFVDTLETVLGETIYQVNTDERFLGQAMVINAENTGAESFCRLLAFEPNEANGGQYYVEELGEDGASDISDIMTEEQVLAKAKELGWGTGEKTVAEPFRRYFPN